MPRIFISYRRVDSRADAGRIYDRLKSAFGKNNIFKDTHNIPLGSDFRAILIKAISDCEVQLVIIGKSWIDYRDKFGERSLDNPDDFVRIEVETALNRKDCLVIPILVNNASMPSSHELPFGIRDLAYREAIVVRDDPNFHDDFNKVIEFLKTEFPDKIESSPKKHKSSPSLKLPLFVILINITAFAISWIISYIISLLIQQSIFDSGYALLGVLLIVTIFVLCNGLIFFYSIIRQESKPGLEHDLPIHARKKNTTNRLYLLIAYLITAFVIVALLVSIINSVVNPLTLHFIVDVTSQMTSSFSVARDEVLNLIETQPSTQIGLREYGNNTTNGTQCPVPNTSLLVPVGPFQLRRQMFISFLENLNSSGNGSMTTAILAALNEDLQEIQGRIRLIVVTSGIDQVCDPIGGGILESLSGSIRQQRPEIDLVIIRIGEPKDDEDAILQRISLAFGGRYFVVPTEQLGEAIQGVSSYGSSYLESWNNAGK